MTLALTPPKPGNRAPKGPGTPQGSRTPSRGGESEYSDFEDDPGSTKKTPTRKSTATKARYVFVKSKLTCRVTQKVKQLAIHANLGLKGTEISKNETPAPLKSKKRSEMTAEEKDLAAAQIQEVHDRKELMVHIYLMHV
jgi:hypothetical protein